MFENACLLTVNQKENDVTFIRIRIPMNFFRTFEPCLEYEYYLLSNQLRDTISDQYRTCFQDGFSFLNIGRKENGDRNALLPGRITRFISNFLKKRWISSVMAPAPAPSCATTSTPIRKWISPTPSLC